MEKRYRPEEQELNFQRFWEENGVNHFNPERVDAVYSIDTPPPTVSGKLHLGHVYSRRLHGALFPDARPKRFLPDGIRR